MRWPDQCGPVIRFIDQILYGRKGKTSPGLFDRRGPFWSVSDDELGYPSCGFCGSSEDLECVQIREGMEVTRTFSRLYIPGLLPEVSRNSMQEVYRDPFVGVFYILPESCPACQRYTWNKKHGC